MLSPVAGRKLAVSERKCLGETPELGGLVRVGRPRGLILGGLSGTVGKFAESSSWFCYSETHSQCAGSARPRLFGGGGSSVVRAPDS